MIRDNTPLDDYRDDALLNMLVKREDLSCPPPGPPFSKTRGVYEHLKRRPERAIGVLDTYHSQAGHAVARACELLGKRCINFYPEYKHEPGPRDPQRRAEELGAETVPLAAGRSAILYHRAKATLRDLYDNSYMMPNALKLPESVTETATEFERMLSTIRSRPDLRGREDGRMLPPVVIIPASSATIASGVILGLARTAHVWPELRPERLNVVIHLGYSRSKDAVLKYVQEKVGLTLGELSEVMQITVVDEGYSYKDKVDRNFNYRPPFPCNDYYDLKALAWWVKRPACFTGGPALFWNIG